MQKTLARITNYIIHLADPEMIILFGSQARGSGTVQSDIDLLVISENITGRKYIARQIEFFAGELSVKTDILIHNKEEIEKASQKPGSFLDSVHKEGKIIYKKNE